MRFFLLILILFFSISCLEATPMTVQEGSGSADGSENIPEEEDESIDVESVSLNEEGPLVMTVGESFQLELGATLSNGEVSSAYQESIVWYSNDADVVSVSDDGEIHALQEGSTTVKGTLFSQSDSIDVIVQDDEVDLTNLDFHQANFSKSSRSSLSLTLDVDFSDGTFFRGISAGDLREKILCDLSFSSSDEDTGVVTQEGLFTPVDNGVTTLKVQCGLRADTVTVTINGLTDVEADPDEQIESLTMTIDSSDWVVGEEKTLTADAVFNTGTVTGISRTFVTPGGTLAALSWEVDDSSLLQIDSGTADLLSYGATTLTATFQEVSDQTEIFVKMASEEPDDSADYFLSSNDNLSISYGTNAGYGDHLFPTIVHGMPQTGGTHVVSFGGGGSLLVELVDYVVVDGPGFDFTLFENPVTLEGYNLFAERASVSVSEDGSSFYSFSCDVDDEDEIYEGCAGVNPVNATENPLDPEVSGGDSFDLAGLSVSTVVFILIEDLDTCSPDDPTYYAADGSLLCSVSGTQGFDLDAVAILNGINN